MTFQKLGDIASRTVAKMKVTHTFTHKQRKATVTEIVDRCHISGMQYQYSVWDPKRGFIGSGFRRTLAEAVAVANQVLRG